MTDKFEEIKEEYTTKFLEHGVSSSAMLMSKGRHEARFSIVAEYLSELSNPTLLDYGCGLGVLNDYLIENKIGVKYLGVDMTESFIDSCSERTGDATKFKRIHPMDELQDTFDVVFASGVFNLQTSQSESESLSYAHDRIEHLYRITNKVLVVDFLSPDVDFRQNQSQHVDYRLLLEWFIPKQTRRWILRHDYLPYEYALVLFKLDGIKRPENTFLEIVDSGDASI